MSLKKIPINFHQIESQSSEIVKNSLSNREIEIIKLAATTLTNKEIGDQLFIDAKTCKKHRENIYKQLNICGKVEVRTFLRWAKDNL